MQYSDLTFKPNPAGGEQAIVSFPNGYGASVIRGPHSYGGSKGLFELAVLDAEKNICYTTPITDDVLGWLTPEDVTKTLRDIEALPAALA